LIVKFLSRFDEVGQKKQKIAPQSDNAILERIFFRAGYCQMPQLSHWALQLAYDGSRFQGFQALPGRRTVQGELERGLNKLLEQPIGVVCAGRTDAGVHAHGQVVGFSASLPFPPKRLSVLLQERLPADMAIQAAWQVPPHFHARFSARVRHYRYLLRPNKPLDPFAQNYSWQVPYPLEPECLAHAWSQLIGKHNFSALARGSQSNPFINVWLAELSQTEQDWALDIVADRFLYSMVRFLVGTVVDIARGKLPKDQLQSIFAADSRRTIRIGPLAPPQGLYLCRALYPPEFGIKATYPQPLSASSEAKIPASALLNPGVWWQ
jgi:tRNA pseudouridine38-40 synthase